jgi:hypothetical protein
MRAQDPPCPWHEGTCAKAAEGGNFRTCTSCSGCEVKIPLVSGIRVHVLVLRREDTDTSSDPPVAASPESPLPLGESRGFFGDTCANAAKGRHWDIVKWVRAQDPPCPWSERACQYAFQDDNFEMLQWLRTQDHPCPIEHVYYSDD